jgi:hypothetical protein
VIVDSLLIVDSRLVIEGTTVMKGTSRWQSPVNNLQSTTNPQSKIQKSRMDD